MNFPLKLSFKKIALSPQISVVDANGNLQFYVKQKLLKLKEAITVFEDKEQTRPLYKINADRVIDFSARYHFKDSNGIELGSIKRQGARSIWKARYDIYDQNEQIVLQVQEENAWIKVMDAFFGEIPLIGMFAGYVFNPVFLVELPDDTLVMKVSKQPALFESEFNVELHMRLNEQDQLRAVLGLLMMTLLERSRG